MIPNTLPQSLADNPRIDQWVGILPGGQVALRTGKVELGQGLLTALVQIAAEELDVAIARILLTSGDTVAAPNEGYTAGSRSVELSGGAIRLVCAEVRALMLEAAAARLGCPVRALSVTDGTILRDDAPTGLDYWMLAGSVDLARPASGTAPAKPAAALRIVGTDVPRRDLPEKLGGAPFIQDLDFPGLLHARVLHRPRVGARLAALDAAGALRAGGDAVALVRSGDLVAVIGEREWQVAAAFERLRERARWEGGVTLDAADSEASSLLARPLAPVRIIRQGEAGGEAASHRLEATYSKPYIAHASIAPSCGLARFEHGTLTVWTHSQGVFLLRGAIACALKLAPDSVHVIHHQGAGCYGHNGADDAAFDAAFAAMARPGQTVRVLWTREDELGVAPFGAAMLVKVSTDLDAQGRPLAWTQEIWSPTHAARPGINGAVNLLGAQALEDPPQDPPPVDLSEAAGGGATRNGFSLYDFPQTIAHHFVAENAVRTSSMRGLGAVTNVFAIECFMDELAEAAGMDPVAYRLSLMSDPRARAVIAAAADMSGWGAVMPDGTARGFAFSRYKNFAAYLATVVELKVDEEVRVSRVWCAVDAGRVINPDGARNQIEGGVIQATSWALKEQVRFADGRVASDQWETYPILRFSEVPEIETRILGTPEDPPLGIGEVSQGPVIAAIGNAVAGALGVRLRHLPLTRARIMAALLEE
ncbi:xanthine dehydrogenase family protein molybdopterin-binding subunit [Xanthobacter dioxanivorans]|uniref:Xanthine dehydrogenase family protein molybdopterin-binding subunit n=1 Tax=Xanthobacter dioxanivorans TaxID=2528964 RepID=A0A974PKP4_9HYPH|nr:molybdopterin cofactor-binding domain-containing protein [Xanthobacter dioxanivorans]QRG05367.1 xanthine dehydrogenase family protein molybdopterin-binding subunit [Xanthobacter dioxanivorans]